MENAASNKDYGGCIIPIVLVLLPFGLIIISLLSHWWITAGVVAVITLLIWLGFFALIELCLRDHYSMDFMFSLKYLIIFFLRRGWTVEKHFGAGSSNPGVIMVKPGCVNVKIIMHSPLLFGKTYIAVFEDKTEVWKKWKFNESNYNDETEIDKIMSPYFGPPTISEDDFEKNVYPFVRKKSRTKEVQTSPIPSEYKGGMFKD